MDTDNKKDIKSEQEIKEEYAYSFVPELDMWLNIDRQKENAKKLSHITDKNKKK